MNSAVGLSFEIFFWKKKKKVFADPVNNAQDPPLFQLNAKTHIFLAFQTYTEITYYLFKVKNK